MDLIDKVMNGLETMARHCGQQLTVRVDFINTAWMITFRAGDAAVICPLRSFCRVPSIVLEPFTEELIKRYVR